MPNPEFYRPKLPHWQPPGSIIFTTFRTFGSLPKEVEKELCERAALLKTAFEGKPPTTPELVLEWKKLFRYMDVQLASGCQESVADGCFLRQPEAAQFVVQSVHHGAHLHHYLLHRYCVMPNHVHLLMEPLPTNAATSDTQPAWPPLWFTSVGRKLLSAGLNPDQVEWRPVWSIMKALKGSSSRRIGQLLSTQPIWFDESFDHWVRDGEEYARIVNYIDNNPVEAGLCRVPQEWGWGSAGEQITQKPDSGLRGADALRREPGGQECPPHGGGNPV